MADAYTEYYEAARTAMRAGASCHDVHMAVSRGFHERGYHLGHVTGHSIGMTMIEFPKIGEGVETELAGEHGPVDAPARDRRERRGLPLHAGHVARHVVRRRPARRPARWRSCARARNAAEAEDVALPDGLVEGEDGVARCGWGGGNDPTYRAYHDDEWGMPVTDDVRLFEKLTLEGFQAGLCWLTILRKREAFRRPSPASTSGASPASGTRDVERLLADAAIVRHRGKIESAINNARRALELVDEFGSLAAYVWRFEPADVGAAEAPDARGALATCRRRPSRSRCRRT